MIAARAHFVDGRGDQFLAGTRLAQQQDRGSCCGHLLGLHQDALEGLAAADKAAVPMQCLDLLPQVHVLLLELVAKMADFLASVPQPVVTFLQRPVVVGAGDRIGKHLADELELPHQCLGPIVLPTDRSEAYCAKPGSSNRQRDQHGRACAIPLPGLFVLRSLGGQIVESGHNDHLAPLQLLDTPGKECAGVGMARNRRGIRALKDMRQLE